LQASETWEKHCVDMGSHLAKNDWSRFTSWPTVRGTMFVGNAPYIKPMFNELMQENSELWRKVLIEPGVGAPARLPYASWTSGQMVRLGYHIAQWGLDFSDIDSIYEFGPGYGVLALLIRRLGFTGDYLMHDLPEFEQLQRYYLDRTNTKATHVDELRGNVDLFIAICSLSETPLDVRIDVLQKVEAESYLLVYQPGVWAGVDNGEFFRDFMASRDDLDWQVYHNPHYPNLWYSIGRYP